MIAYGHHTMATMDNTRTDEQAGACTPRRSPAATPTRASRRRCTAGQGRQERPRPVPQVPQRGRLRRRPHPHQRVDLFKKGRSGLLADQHRLARRLPAAEPRDRADGQPRRHAVAVRRRCSTRRRRSRRPPRARRGGADRRAARRASAACWPGTTRSARPTTRAPATTATSNSSSWTHAPCSRCTYAHPLVEPRSHVRSSASKVMYKPLSLAAATLAVAAVVPATASAAWTRAHHPLLRRRGEPDRAGRLRRQRPDGLAQADRVAFQGARRARAPITAADPFENVWDGGLDKDGNAIVLTVRKHKPLQRIRAIFVAADGTRAPPARSPTTPTRPPSRRSPSRRTAPRSRAGRGTTRRAGAPRSRSGGPASRASTSRRRSPRPRPTAGAATCGRSSASPRGTAAARSLTWQVQTGMPKRRCTSSARGGLDLRRRPGAGGRRPLGRRRARGRPAGAVTVAYLGEVERPDQPARRVRDRGRPARRAHGALHRRQRHLVRLAGRGRLLGRRHADRRVGQARQPLRGRRDARGLPGRRRSRPQTLAEHADGDRLAGGPGSSAALAWMTGTPLKTYVKWVVHASTRPAAGGAFGADTVLSGCAECVVAVDRGDAREDDRGVGGQRQRRREWAADRGGRSVGRADRHPVVKSRSSALVAPNGVARLDNRGPTR